MYTVPGDPGRRTSGGLKGEPASTIRNASAPLTGGLHCRFTALNTVFSACTSNSQTAPEKTDSHRHCLDYLHQQALCHRDITLESGDLATCAWEVGRLGEIHTSRGFDTAWDYNVKSWLDWYYLPKETCLIVSPIAIT